MRIRAQLTASHLFAVLIILILVLVLLNGMARSHFLTEAHTDLVRQGETLTAIMAAELLFRGLRAPTLPDDRIQAIGRTASALIDGDFVLLSTAGDMLIRSDDIHLPPEPQERLELEPVQQALAEGEIVSDRGKGPDGTALLAAFVPITLQDGRPPIGLVIAFRSESEAVAPVRDMQRITLQVGALALATGIILSFVLSRILSEPAEKLSHVARALRRGDLEQRAPEVSTHEYSQMAQMINQITERLSESMQKRRAFIASISHEIRTPVTSIRGFVQALQDGVISEEDRDQYLETIMGETRRIQRLLEDLLQLERLETGQLSMQFDWISADELVDRATSRIAHAARQKEVTVEADIPEDGRLQIWADAERLDQVLGNLTENAIRYTPPHGTIELGVRLLTQEHDPEKALFWVADDGPGVPEDEINTIFETFYQVSASTHEGAGLGLAISREIIGGHNGQIWVENRPGGGALFQFTLPHVRIINRDS